MQVYKTYFKIIRKNKVTISIYILVFLIMAILFGNLSGEPTDRNFEESKVKVSIINEDSEGLLSKGLEEYIKEHSEVVEIEDNNEALQDALYFRAVEYIIRIPKGFSKSLGTNNVRDIERTIIPNSTSSLYMDTLIDKYLNTGRIYLNNGGNLSEEEILEYIKEDLNINSTVDIVNDTDKTSTKYINYYNYIAYSVFAVLILGVASVMITFNDKNLQRRKLCAPVKRTTISKELILGNIVFAIGIWGIMIMPSFILYKNEMFSKSGGLLMLNSLLFTIAALSIAYGVGTLVKSRNAMSAAANVISLGSCFLGGVFVPQEFLGEGVKGLSRFIPTYWYVKGNEEISVLTNYSFENLKPLIINMVIIGLFAVAIFSISMVIAKQRKTIEE